jgi:uncharacterized small protein (DUF1192 family)
MRVLDQAYASLAEQHRLEEERAARRQALLEEREQCERRGLGDRVAAIDAELERLGPARELPELPSPEERRRQNHLEWEREAALAALREERRGYEVRGLEDRVALVDAEIARIGADDETPARRAEKRPAGRAPRARR